MHRDLLIPTSWDSERLKPLLESISTQTLQPDKIIFLQHWSVSDNSIKQTEELLHSFFAISITHLHHKNTDYIPNQWVGYDRNFLLHQTQSEYTFMIDDDNVFGSDFFQLCVDEYDKFEGEDSNSGLQILYSPQIEYHHTGVIQSVGVTWFRRWMPKFRYAKAWSEQERKMIGANSLFWPTKLFQEIWFDRQFESCLEDIDFSYRVWKSGAKIVVSDAVRIQHMERQKSLLEKKFLWSPEMAYERSRNRILFAKKNATPYQKIQYFGLWFWAQTFWFLWLSSIYGWSDRFDLVSSILRWTFDGIFSR